MSIDKEMEKGICKKEIYVAVISKDWTSFFRILHLIKVNQKDQNDFSFELRGNFWLFILDSNLVKPYTKSEQG